MPTFGDYETIGEPIESREDTGHFTRVWQARRINTKDGRLYAVKCYIPRRHRRVEGEPKEALEEHRSLEFIEGVKQIKKAAEGGQKCLTPIYDFGLTPWGEGAWYVTDFYGDATPVLPRTLRSYIIRGGKVDGAALRHTIQGVVLGCLVLKRSRGFSHGNLKTTNVFRAGKPRALCKTPLVLGDAFPAAPLQLAQLDPQNKLEVSDLLKEIMEAHDLYAIGELILQLVEVRLMTSKGDFDYPIDPSPAWHRLGKDGDRWRELCNRLLDPSLSLERTNLELLEKELRPGLVSSHAPMVAGAVVLLCLLGVGGYFGWRYYEQWRYDKYMKEATLQASKPDPTNIIEALTLVNDALLLRPADRAAIRLEKDTIDKRDGMFDAVFRKGRDAFAAQKFEESVTQLKIATMLKPDDLDANGFLKQALKAQEKEKARQLEAAKRIADEKAKADKEAAAKRIADEKAKADKEAAAKRIADEKAKADKEAAAKRIADEKAKADAKAREDAKAAQSREPTPQINFTDVFGNIPDLDFVRVAGIGPRDGTYVAVNELSRGQYKALGGNDADLMPGSDSNLPAAFKQDKAKHFGFDTANAFVDSLNGKFAGKGVKFRLPGLDEYKTLSGMTDFAAISNLVATTIKSAGEDFSKSPFPKKITAVPTANNMGLRNVIGNVREWTAEGVPFGNSYSWGQSQIYTVTNDPRNDEAIGLRLICEPTNR